MPTSEEVTLEGHIVDSLILSTVMDEIVSFGGTFRFLDFNVGQDQDQPSFARLQVTCDDGDKLAQLLSLIAHHGAVVESPADAELQAVEADGVFPKEFYSTTNQQSYVRHSGKWVAVRRQEMDCGLRATDDGGFECVPVINVRKGDRIVCGYRGVKVEPQQRGRGPNMFEFMSSAVSSEKPKNVLIREVARRMKEVREAGRNILLVGGPAIVHTGAGRHVVRLIETGYVNVLFAGNALATHDIEQALFNTSLGVHLERALPIDAGHEHHIRAINAVRACGGIRQAIEQGVLTSGIMHTCVRHDVDYVLAGSVRDDGPLPDVITDVMQAQDRMRSYVDELGFVLIVATALHGIATGNILPAWIPMVCVDIESAVVTKIADRGSWQTVGIVTDVEPFFNELLENLNS
jgi:lysine-ketoglutarate reductase/saccharopine dehydrogenase-like protein (TIGR00300 family)